jgi:lipoprotein-anchoring transpeptidase ErfK/SrfK
MKLKIALFSLLATAVVGTSSLVKADEQSVNTLSPALVDEDSAMDDFDPFDPNVEEQLNLIDQQYEAETGMSAHLPNQARYFGTGCRRETCAVYAHVSKTRQLLSLYENGVLTGQFATSTGMSGHGTPNFDKHPDGRIYDKYMSKTYPGGDYNGLGNMPYAVFIKGGFAIHGTGKSNWPKLGRRASHGCIRVHPDNAYRFNRLVRQVGIANTWITVED